MSRFPQVIVSVLVMAAAGFAQESELRVRAQAANDRGVASHNAGAFSEAIRHFEEARQLLPNEAAFTRNLARAYHGRGVESRRKKNHGIAEQDARIAEGLDTAEPLFSQLLALSLLELDRLGEARVVLTHALGRHPEASVLHEVMGRIDYLEEELEAAVESLKKAVATAKTPSPSLKNFLAKVERESQVEKGFYKDARGPFLVKCDDRAFRGISTRVLNALDSISNRISTDLGLALPGRLTVVLYTREDYQSATLAHGWTGALYDGKIRLPVRNYESAESVISATLAHEMTHWFIRHWAPHCPLWLNEGLAQMQENPRNPTVPFAVLSRGKREGQILPMSKLPSDWASEADASRIGLYYAQALGFTDFLARRFGDASLRELLAEFREPTPLADAIQTVFRRSLPDLEADWFRDL